MKNIFRVVGVMFVMAGLLQSVSAQHSQEYCGDEIVPTAYEVVGGGINYCGKQIEGAVSEGFIGLGYGYAEDANQAYYMGKVIVGADPATFQITDSSLISKDVHGVYCNGSLLTADVANFILLNVYGPYADSKSVYWGCHKIENSDPQTFVKLDNDFFKDKNNLYYQGKAVSADLKTVEALGNGYAKDATRIIFKDQGVVAQADLASFQIRAAGIDNEAVFKQCGGVFYDAFDKSNCFARGKIAAVRNGEVLLKAQSHFSDVSKESLNYLYDKGIFVGYTDGTFGYDKPLSRAELLKIVLVAQGMKPKAVTGDCFTDVHPADWYAPYVCMAKDLGYVSGYPNGSFKPNSSTNKVEALKMIAEGLTWDIGTDREKNVEVYQDTDKSQWYFKYILSGLAHFYIEMDESKRFEPASSITRGQAAEMIFRKFVDMAERGSGFTSKEDVAAAEREFLWAWEEAKG